MLFYGFSYALQCSVLLCYAVLCYAMPCYVRLLPCHAKLCLIHVYAMLSSCLLAVGCQNQQRACWELWEQFKGLFLISEKLIFQKKAPPHPILAYKGIRVRSTFLENPPKANPTLSSKANPTQILLDRCPTIHLVGQGLSTLTPTTFINYLMIEDAWRPQWLLLASSFLLLS